MTIPYIFQNRINPIPLRELDDDLAAASGGTTGWTSSRSTQTAVASQSVFVGIPAYVPGTDSLIISVNGLVLAQSDYTETSDTTVTFATPFVGGEQVDFLSGNWVTFGIGKINAVDNGAVSAEPTGASFYFRRNANVVGGSSTYVNSCVFADSYVMGAGETAIEWAILGRLTNSATAGDNSGGYFQGIKNAGAGPTFGAVVEVIDNGAGNPATGVVALEIDISANGTDSSNNKLGIYMTSRRQNLSGAANVAGYGIKLDNDAGSSYTVGIDFASATFGQCAMRVAQGHSIAFNAAATRQLVYNGGGLNFLNPSVPTSYWSFNDDGSLTGLGSVQMLGTRRPGWTTVPTGTVSRLTFDESTVTLAQLAQRVAALIIDFHSTTGHGLIGA